MFSYYGRKLKVVRFYPAPIYDTIIEPFCGSAVYSLFQNNWEKNIILVDKYDVIIRIWKYLQSASSDDILKLPNVKNGEELIKVDGFTQLLQEEKWLIGFSVNGGSGMPKNVAGVFNSWHRDKKYIAENLYKIRHWTIKCDDYKNIENIKATWFIDPPYQCAGKYYKHKIIDYDFLSKWCKCRNGQVIVCENSTANWLPFISLKEMQGQLHKTTEVMYYQDDIPPNPNLIIPNDILGDQME